MLAEGKAREAAERTFSLREAVAAVVAAEVVAAGVKPRTSSNTHEELTELQKTKRVLDRLTAGARREGND